MYVNDARELIDMWIRLCRKSIDGYLLDSREKSLALTKLDECEMWAKKCVLADDNVS